MDSNISKQIQDINNSIHKLEQKYTENIAKLSSLKKQKIMNLEEFIERKDNYIQISKATKKYKKGLAVNNADFSLKSGYAYGLIGPNGAGKTTLIKMLTNAISASSGELKIDNFSSITKESIRKFVYITEKARYPSKATVKSYYRFLLSQNKEKYPNWEKDFEKIRSHFHTYKISLRSNLRSLSSGMQKIVAIIYALVQKPDLYILDEPAENMDFDARGTMFRLLKDQINLNKTIIISSHNLTEIEEFIDYAIFINEGVIKGIYKVDGEKGPLSGIYNKVFGVNS